VSGDTRSATELASRISGLSPEKQALLARKLAARASQSVGHADRIEPRGDHSPAPLSHAQELLWLYEQMTAGTAAYNVPMARRVRGPLDLDALRGALDVLVARHESLRTSIVEIDGEPRQVARAPRPTVLSVRDLRATAAELRDAEAERLIVEDAARPFDLADGTFPRVTVVRLADDDVLLLVVVHHIVFDGASTGILFQELAQAYEEAVAHSSSTLPALPIQLADYAAWDRREHDGARLAASVQFWRDYLAGALTSIDLPLDFVRPAGGPGPGARYATTLPRATRDAVHMLATSHRVTPFVVLLAAFQSLLHRYSGQEDLVVGTAVAGRSRPETARLVGYLASTLALRSRFDDDPSFSDLLRRVGDGVVEALGHHDVPYELLVRELRSERAPVEQGLFRVMLTLQDTSEATTRLGAATMSPVGLDLGAAKFDLALSVADVDNGLRVAVEYRRDLFEAASIERLMRHLDALIAAAAEQPRQPVSRLPLAGALERRELVAQWSTTVAVPAADTLMHRLFERWATTKPDAMALRFQGRTLTYGELDAAAEARARELRERGVRPNTIVGLCVERSLDFPIGVLAVLKAGGAYLPLDPSYPRERLAYMLEDSGAPILLTQRALEGRAPVAGTVIFMDGIGESASTSAGHPRVEGGASPDDLAYVIYTSGSTGRPKGALLRHRGACNLAAALGALLEVKPTDRVLQFSALSFDASVLEILWSLAHGASLHLASQEVVTNPDALAFLIEGEGITGTLLPPVMLRALDPQRVPGLSTVLSGGDECGADIVRRWAPNRRLFNAYGPTEITVVATIGRCDAADQGAPPIGTPLPGNSGYVLDPAGNAVPIGVPGELFVGGAGVGQGYLGRPELTRERFVPDPFAGTDALMYRTGDRVRWRADGRLDFLGRLDQQVKLRGYRIELGEIESVLAAQSGVAATAVTVQRDGGENDRLIAFYCAKPGETVDETATLAALRARLPAFMVPAALVEMESLPLSPAGKVNRSLLPFVAAAPRSLEGLVEPRNPVEAVVAGVWATVLHVDRVGVETSFFDLGGHSLLATRIVGQISRIFRTQLPLRQFFELPTVAAIAGSLQAAEPKPGQAAAVARAFQKIQQMTPEEREELRRKKAGIDQTPGSP
jgi:amino acid adenylation domain-containing protein